MKRLYSIIFLALTGTLAKAQPILSNGFGSLALLDGVQYKKTANIGTGNFGNVSASVDGQYFYATGANSSAAKIYYISVASNTIVDSVELPNSGGDMSSTNDVSTVFSLRGMAVYRLNPKTKAIDSLVLPGRPNRIEERPGAKEAWIAADSVIYVVNYNSALTLSNTIRLTSGKNDNADVRFSKGGTVAYKAAGSTKKIYRIDCATKVVVDSIDTAPFGHFGVEVSTDSSKVYAPLQGDTTLYAYSVSSKTRVDSMKSNKGIMNIYRHPTRQELWAVHHFSDSVTVFDETTKARLASFDIGNDPFFLAFSVKAVGVYDVLPGYDVAVYPNPANAVLNISLSKNTQVQLVVYDAFGRVLARQAATNNASINTSSFAAGNYYVAIYECNDLMKTVSFVKQ